MSSRAFSCAVSRSSLGFWSWFSSRPRVLAAWPIVSLLTLSACGGTADPQESTAHSEAAVSAQGEANGRKPKGDELFETAFQGTNGRSCWTRSCAWR